MKDYLVIYERAEDGGWGAHSPDVEGVFARRERRARRPRSAWPRLWPPTWRTCAIRGSPRPSRTPTPVAWLPDLAPPPILRARLAPRTCRPNPLGRDRRSPDAFASREKQRWRSRRDGLLA